MKKLLILGVTALVVVVCIVAIVGFLLLRGSKKATAAMPGVTEIGTPTGEATTKSIGPAGGTIASPDGAIVVSIPPNAVAGPTNMSIQAITNLANGGTGSGYRLEPGGNFAAPVKISLKVGDEDMAGSPTIAFQDATGAWQAFNKVDIDQTNKTISIETTHFTDFAGVTYKLTPEKATLKVGESIKIKLIGCREEDSLLNTIQRLFTTPHVECTLTTAQSPEWSTDFGTVAPSGVGVMYTAPARRPEFGVAEVVLKFNVGSFVGREVSKITIVEQGYRALGTVGDTIFSGNICNLEAPFEVGTYNQFLGPLEFTPSDDKTRGSWKFTTRGGSVIGGGGGEYWITGTDTEKTGIELNGTSAAYGQGYGRRTPTLSGGGNMHLTLTPLTGNECGGG